MGGSTMHIAFAPLRLCGLLLGLAATLLVWGAARAEDPPAVQAAPAEQRAALKALIEAAKKEGVVNYWDAVIQPETNEALTKDFRKRYGLPNGFGVKYTLSVTTNLITRVEQEVAA